MSKKGPLGWATSCAAVPCKCVGGLHHNVPSRCQMVASERVLPVLHLGLVLFLQVDTVCASSVTSTFNEVSAVILCPQRTDIHASIRNPPTKKIEV